MLHELTSSDFAAFLDEHPVALVEFTGPGCGPCAQMKPLLEEIAEVRGGIALIDAFTAPDLAARFAVQALPTLIFFRDREPVHQIVGLGSRQVLEDKLDELSSR